MKGLLLTANQVSTSEVEIVARVEISKCLEMPRSVLRAIETRAEAPAREF
jgi:hypothetical protein